MWFEDMRLEDKYSQEKCKLCKYARTCEDSIHWILCINFRMRYKEDIEKEKEQEEKRWTWKK